MFWCSFLSTIQGFIRESLFVSRQFSKNGVCLNCPIAFHCSLLGQASWNAILVSIGRSVRFALFALADVWFVLKLHRKRTGPKRSHEGENGCGNRIERGLQRWFELVRYPIVRLVYNMFCSDEGSPPEMCVWSTLFINSVGFSNCVSVLVEVSFVYNSVVIWIGETQLRLFNLYVFFLKKHSGSIPRNACVACET